MAARQKAAASPSRPRSSGMRATLVVALQLIVRAHGLGARTATALTASSLDTSHAACASNESFLDFIVGPGNISVSTSFGRNLQPARGMGCACRFCEDGDVRPRHAGYPRHVTSDSDVSYCFSTYPGELNWRDKECGASIGPKVQEEDVQRFLARFDHCFEPVRNSSDLPTRTLWLIGDSTSGSVRAGLTLAVRGSYQVRYFGVSFYGLLMSDKRLHSVETSRNRAVMLAMRALYVRFKQLLTQYMQEGDLLVIMEEDMQFLVLDGDAAIAQVIEHDLLDGIIKRANASLVVLGGWPRGDINATSALPGDVFARAHVAKLLQTAFDKHDTCGDATPCPPGTRPGYFISLFESYCDGELPNYDKLLAARIEDRERLQSLPDNQTLVPLCWTKLPGTSNVTAYADAPHLNTVGAIYLWPQICDAMEAVGLL
jgi:hypothetical protein